MASAEVEAVEAMIVIATCSLISASAINPSVEEDCTSNEKRQTEWTGIHESGVCLVDW